MILLIRNLLMLTVAALTNHKRYHPEYHELDLKLHWSNKIWISNIFRAYEWLFGRGFGIRPELSTSLYEKNGRVYAEYHFHSFEAFVCHIEVIIRSVLIALLNGFKYFDPFGIPKPALITLGIFGLVFHLKTSSHLLPLFGIGAIALNANTAGTNTTVSPITWTHTCTGSNLILFAEGANSTGGTATISTPTYNSVSMTLVGSQRAYSLNVDMMALYFLIAPSTGANTLSMGFGGASPKANGASVSYSGVLQSGQPDAVGGNTGTTANPSVTVTTVADGCWVIGALGSHTTNAFTPGLTDRQSFLYGNASDKADIQDTNGAIAVGTVQTVSWTQTTSGWGVQACSFAPVADSIVGIGAANTGGSSAGANFNLTTPTGATTGDFILVAITERDTTNKVTNVGNGTHNMTHLGYFNAASASLDLWWYVLQAGDSTTWTVTSTANAEGAIIAYRGADTVSPIDAQGSSGSGTTSPAAINAVTAIATSTRLINILGMNFATGNNVVSNTLGLMERADAGNGGGTTSKQAIWVADIMLSSAGSSGANSATLNSNQNYGSYGLTIKVLTISTVIPNILYSVMQSVKRASFY